MGRQMKSTFELNFPCFIVRRDDASRFSVVQLPTGERAIVILTDPHLVQMFLFERCWEGGKRRPLPINTAHGLARILERHIPKDVTHVVFDPNGVAPRTEPIDRLLRVLRHTSVPIGDTFDF
jgi:hypothetical protein